MIAALFQAPLARGQFRPSSAPRLSGEGAEAAVLRPPPLLLQHDHPGAAGGPGQHGAGARGQGRVKLLLCEEPL